MTITDRIFGTVEVTNPLIAELIASAPMERLKHISQDGATHYIETVCNGNRFEHSFGTWYLAWRFDRPLQEQVACLLHDVPHTAFSHVVDFVMDDPSQEYDRFLKQVVYGSDIPDICKRHGLDITIVLQKENYYLLDNNTPELSFDRWDYFMRDANMIGILPLATVEQIVSSAHIRDGRFCFTNLTVASQLCLTTLMVCQLVYISANSHGSWFLLASALKTALQQGIITEQDLFTTDKEVWTKLQAAHSTEVDAYLQHLNPNTQFEYASEAQAEFYGHNKARYIDPLVVQGGKLVPTSQLVPGLASYIAAFKEKCQYIGVKQRT